ncbi:MAG: ATP-binding protein [Xanthomonadales bacterium]|nr:ATP-binding protein [Xanthomonadales bacterium]
MPEAQSELVLQQTADIARSIDHYLARAKTSGAKNLLGSLTPVKAVIEDLLFVMRRLYRQRELDFDTSGLGSCAFRGDAQDLEDMLGNLLDNAGKWARKRILVHCKSRNDRLLLSIEDDGAGIPEEELESALERGRKLDESRSGQGLGLAIAHEIAELYGGKLTLSRSGYGGLCAELELPGEGQCDAAGPASPGQH